MAGLKHGDALGQFPKEPMTEKIRVNKLHRKMAEAWLCGMLKADGPLEYIDDGKTDMYMKLKYKDLVRLFALYTAVLESIPR